MERGATSNSIFVFPASVDISEIAAIELIVTGADSGVTVAKKDSDIEMLEGNKMGVFFTQEDTLRFRDNEDLRLQWHWRNRNGTASVSKVKDISIYEFLGSEPI